MGRFMLERQNLEPACTSNTDSVSIRMQLCDREAGNLSLLDFQSSSAFWNKTKLHLEAGRDHTDASCRNKFLSKVNAYGMKLGVLVMGTSYTVNFYRVGDTDMLGQSYFLVKLKYI